MQNTEHRRIPPAPVASLADYRKSRAARPVPEPETDPCDVLEVMIEAYMKALSAQLKEVRAARCRA